MHVRFAFALATVAALVAVAGSPAAAPVESANGGAHWTIPLPNAFGVEVVNRTLAFNAREYADGSVSGHFEYHQVVEGEAFKFNVAVTLPQRLRRESRQARRRDQGQQRPDAAGRNLRLVPGVRQRRGSTTRRPTGRA